MRISDREIEESLRALARQAAGEASAQHPDDEARRFAQGCLAGVPDMRMDLVLPLQLAVQEHRYHVPEILVADKLLGRCLADHLR